MDRCDPDIGCIHIVTDECIASTCINFECEDANECNGAEECAVCLGCFMAQPTQFSSDGNERLRSCQSCSRILYAI